MDKAWRLQKAVEGKSNLCITSRSIFFLTSDKKYKIWGERERERERERDRDRARKREKERERERDKDLLVEIPPHVLAF